jgi:hypothetical protein
VAFGSLAAPVLDEGFAPIKKNPWPLRGLGLLAAAVAVFALYRNGVGSDALGSNAASQATSDVTTPHGMNSWLNSVDSKYGLSGTTPTGASVSSPSSLSRATEDSSSPSGKLKLADLPKDEASSSPSSLASATAFGDLLHKKEAKATPAPKAKSGKSSSTSRPAKKAAKTQGHASDAYDPMNGTL